MSIADACVSFLVQRGIALAPGLSDAEIASVEQRFGFEFGVDHRAFLSRALPTGEGWVDWRGSDDANLAGRMAWPIDGALFDVEHNGYWPVAWGPRPSDAVEAVAAARAHVAAWHKLVPVHSHRYTPAMPVVEGAPVFSVHQTDVIFYGSNLLDYFQEEFGPRKTNETDADHLRLTRYEPWTTIALGDDEDISG